MEGENVNFYSQRTFKESKLSWDIRILAEVEKIWIMYDLDDNKELDYEEIKLYLNEVAYPHLDLTE